MDYTGRVTTDFWQLVGTVAVAGVVVGLWLVLRRSNLVPEAEARRWLAAGALVIDVRSASEFAGEHLPGVINLPLDALAGRIGSVCPDKSAPVLLHCHSGGRSGMGRMLLRRAGYSQVHNLGSYGRARRLLAGTPGRPGSAG